MYQHYKVHVLGAKYVTINHHKNCIISTTQLCCPATGKTHEFFRVSERLFCTHLDCVVSQLRSGSN